MSRCWLLVGLAFVAFGRNAAGQTDPLSGVEAEVSAAMKLWEIPGLAMAIVKDDQIILQKGFGVRKLGDSAPVDEKTVFAIASCSKAFTAAALAILVDEGKIRWDTRVVDVLPHFQMHDPAVTRELTIRDLLCHRTGLARHDQVWYDSDASRDEVLRRLRFAKPTWSFRSQFGYQNIMFLAAGQIVPAVTKQSWDEFVATRFFQPLRMTRSSTSATAISKLENTATPHARVEGKMTAIDWVNLDNAGPAGSINSCVADMAQWLRLQLADGAFEKKRLIGPGLVREMHSPQMPIRTSGMGPEGRRWDIFFTDANFPSYGLGWMVRDFRGHRCAMHGGSIDGMNSWVALLPELKLGIVVLTNFNPNLAMAGLSYRVFDRFLGAPERDWSAEFKKKQAALEELRANFLRQQDRERVRDTKPTLALEKYAGTYRDDLYGPVVISADKNRLTVRQGRTAIGDLSHWHYDTFRIEWRDRRTPASLATFHLNEQGEVHEVKIPSLGDLVGIKQLDKPKP